jgi:hypothetical protein
MTIYTEPNMTGGMDTLLISLVSEIPALPIMIMVFTYLVVLMGGTSSQNRRQGYSDFPMWNLIASLSILLIALILTVTAGVINLFTLGIVVSINILSGFWFFMSRGRYE